MQLKKIIKEITPPFILGILSFKKKNIRKEKTITPFICPVCNNNIEMFERLPDYYFELWNKYQYVHSIFCSETLNFIHYSCPICGTSDRNRLYALFLKNKFKSWENTQKTYTFLDIAPDKTLGDWIKTHKFLDYRSMDLYMEEADDKADITDMNIYKENQFDGILCSHVLEHIKNDKKAMSEIYRILKPGGFGIIMVPIVLNIDHDIESEEYYTEDLRWKYFGQYDHVRCYSKQGFTVKLAQTGFVVKQLGKDFFGEAVFEKHGIHPRSILYVVEK